MDINELQTEVNALFEQFKAQQFYKVRAGDSLQAALNVHKNIELEPGSNFEGTYQLRSGNTIKGYLNRIHSSQGPALIIEPNTNDVSLSGFEMTSDFHTVFRAGRNDKLQVDVASMPKNITLENVVIPRHRGKRGFELNCRAALINCEGRDLFDPQGQDSQVIAFLNTVGNSQIIGGHYEGGSESILTGGDTMKMPVLPSGFNFLNFTSIRPLSWQTDGVARKLKNPLEIKTATDSIIAKATIDGSWKDAQDGYGIVLTPRSGGQVVNVTIDSCIMRNVSSGFQILGVDNASVTPQKTTGIVIKNTKIEASKAKFGGRGVLALIVDGAGTISFDNVDFTGDADYFLYCDSRDTAAKNGGVKLPIDELRVTNSRIRCGKYGIVSEGNNWGENFNGKVIVEGNTFTEAHDRFKKQFPNNTYL